jgi:hypothetical protein
MKLKAIHLVVPSGALAVLVLAVLISSQFKGAGAPAPAAPQAPIPFAPAGVRVIAVGDRAFGDLSLVATEGDPALGGGLRTATDASAAPAAVPAPSVPEDEKMMIMPYEPVYHRFVYKGEPLVLDAASADVLKRVKPSGVPAPAAVTALAPGLIDLSRMPGLRLQAYSMVQDRDFGYFVNVDLFEGHVSLSQYWQRWPHPELGCADDACWQAMRIRPEQIPSDEEAIRIADAFMNESGIDRGLYGPAEVRGEWRGAYDLAQDKSLVYLPESINVVYPLRIDGRDVLFEGGEAFGLIVNVNVRHRRVDGMWNLMTHDYQAAAYALETDPKRILDVTARGGVYGWMPEGEDVKVVDVEIGAPERVLLKVWHSMSGEESQELIVPALKFPVIAPPEGEAFYRTAVVVPLVRELLDQGAGGGGVMPMPVPLMAQ